MTRRVPRGQWQIALAALAPVAMLRAQDVERGVPFDRTPAATVAFAAPNARLSAPLSTPTPRMAVRGAVADTTLREAEAAIRAARARSNAAIARHDTSAIAAEWMPDVHVVSSAGLQLSGRAENARALQAQFVDRPDVVYVRTPDSLQVYSPWGMAAEFGHWQGSWTLGDRKIEIGGPYFGKWQRVDGRWLIQAEVFVPGWCRGGPFCERKP